MAILDFLYIFGIFLIVFTDSRFGFLVILIKMILIGNVIGDLVIILGTKVKGN